ncbi:dual specificity mitogen-activated protein kinase kinase sek-1-like isoform X2 [Convolutriloba macropyga]|uniref:dual specificity mitogen-activated protein kinase kinase sek-1-like isoform X2 n=1 Tax=Convolutriloba macropyga TaxID=536237 RepID=UPI003F52729A
MQSDMSDTDSYLSSPSGATSGSSRPSSGPRPSSGRSPRFLSRKPSIPLSPQFFPSSDFFPGQDLYDDPDFKKLLQRGTIELEGEELEISTNDIETEKRLGSGQYGHVYRCHIKSHPRYKLAYKSVRLELEPKKKKLILAELETTKKVKNHAYAVQTFCTITFETNIWFIMELMDMSLDDLIKARNSIAPERRDEVARIDDFPPEPVVRLVAYACVECLSYLKSLDIIHRDVKPANILIRCQTGEVKVGDFGISGKLLNSLAETKIFQIQYVSPERVRYDEMCANSTNRPVAQDDKDLTSIERNKHKYSVKSDIWSMGVTCYEFVTGENPFNEKDKLFDTLKKITEYDPPKLNRRAAVSNDLSKFAGRCLRKDPRERPRYESLKKSPFFANFDESSDRKRLTKYCKQFENLCG